MRSKLLQWWYRIEARHKKVHTWIFEAVLISGLLNQVRIEVEAFIESPGGFHFQWAQLCNTTLKLLAFYPTSWHGLDME